MSDIFSLVLNFIVNIFIEIIAIFIMIFSAIKNLIASKKVGKVNVDINQKIKYKKIINDNKKLKILFIVNIILLIIIIFLLVLFILKIQTEERFLIFTILIIMTIVCAINYYVSNKIFKEEIIIKALNEISPDLVYNHNKGISEADYRFADFEKYDRFKSEDLISGNILNNSFIISDVLTYNTENVYKHRGHYRKKVFSVLVAKVNLKKDIQSFIYIINNKLRLFDSKYKIIIDNESFNKKYDVYSDNEILTMRILTPAVTSLILDMETKTGVPFELKIYKNVIYFRFYTKNLFQLGLTANSSAKNLAYSLEIINCIQAIMKELLQIISDVEV